MAEHELIDKRRARHLERAQRDVDDSERRISKQRELLAERRRLGFPMEEAEETLADDLPTWQNAPAPRFYRAGCQARSYFKLGYYRHIHLDERAASRNAADLACANAPVSRTGGP